jgi:hypothetical protein
MHSSSSKVPQMLARSNGNQQMQKGSPQHFSMGKESTDQTTNFLDVAQQFTSSTKGAA